MKEQPIPTYHRSVNLTGQSFGKWTVVYYIGKLHNQIDNSAGVYRLGIGADLPADGIER